MTGVQQLAGQQGWRGRESPHDSSSRQPTDQPPATELPLDVRMPMLSAAADDYLQYIRSR
jgi:hypothetical protein